MKADNRDTTGQFFYSTPLCDSFEDVVAFRHEAVNRRLVLGLSHRLSSLSIWPAVWPQSAVPFSRASVVVLWFLLFTCSRTPAFILWLRACLPPVFQVSCLTESVLGISSRILLVPAMWLVWAPACTCLMCDPCTGCPLPETLSRKQRSDPSLGVRYRGRLHSDTLSWWEALMLITSLWSICLSTKTTILSLVSLQALLQMKTCAAARAHDRKCHIQADQKSQALARIFYR